MGLEEDFLLADADDEKTIEFIKNYLPQELKEKFSDDELYYFLDLIESITLKVEFSTLNPMKTATLTSTWKKWWLTS